MSSKEVFQMKRKVILRKLFTRMLVLGLTLSLFGCFSFTVVRAADEPSTNLEIMLVYVDGDLNYHILLDNGDETLTWEDYAQGDDIPAAAVWTITETVGADLITGTSGQYLYINDEGDPGLCDEGDIPFLNAWYYNYDSSEDYSYLQFADVEQDIDHVFMVGDYKVFPYTYSDDGVSRLSWVYAASSYSGETNGEGNTDAIYLAFGSDRHGNTSAIKDSMSGMPSTVSYVALPGDLAKTTESYETSVVLKEVTDFFENGILDNTNVDLIYGSHDIHAQDDGTGIMNGAEESGLIYTGTDGDGNVLYYVYGIAYDSMTSASMAQTEAAEFEAWVDEIDCTIPIIAAGHVPTHKKRNDNLGATYWHAAFNYAATGSEDGTEIIRNVVYLSGHNHTVETTLYNYEPGDSYTIQGTTKDTLESVTAYYSYITDGYMSNQASGKPTPHSTLIEITDDTITYYQFPAASVDTATVLQSVTRTAHQKSDTVIENEVAATCTEAGSYDEAVYCSVCGEELSRETTTIEALGHNWDDGVITTQATCTKAGVMTYTCETCGETKTEEIAATGHTAGDTVKENEAAATCTVADSYDEVVYCSVCNEEISRKTTTIDATGHQWGDWSVAKEATETETGLWERVCSVCGEKETQIIPVIDAAVYELVSGEGATWNNGSAGSLTFRFIRTVNNDEAFSHFQGIMVDGTTVAKTNASGDVNYTAESGSVIVTLNPVCLQTLTVGSHTLTAVFDDAENVSASFTVAASGSGSAATGDPNQAEWWLLLMACAAATACVLASQRKKANI